MQFGRRGGVVVVVEVGGGAREVAKKCISSVLRTGPGPPTHGGSETTNFQNTATTSKQASFDDDDDDVHNTAFFSFRQLAVSNWLDDVGVAFWVTGDADAKEVTIIFADVLHQVQPRKEEGQKKKKRKTTNNISQKSTIEMIIKQKTDKGIEQSKAKCAKYLARSREPSRVERALLARPPTAPASK